MGSSLACLLLVMSLVPSRAGAVPPVIRIDELSLRRAATKIVMPAYPAESQQRGAQGVAVAELVFDGGGDVYRARILEAPDEPIRQAVMDAVRQWKFKPQTLKGEAVYIRGKLTFYYRIEKNGAGRVDNPRQVN